MSFTTDLKSVALRLKSDDDDLRHTVLEISDVFLAIARDVKQFPEPLRDELAAVVEELKSVQPIFKSQRKTSVLFDRAGLGKAGRDQAANLARRMISLAEITLLETK